MGKQTNDNRPLEEYFGSGVILDIKGTISGASSLTKVGYDTVILSGANTYSGGTNANGGRRMLAGTNALDSDRQPVHQRANGCLIEWQQPDRGRPDNPGHSDDRIGRHSGFITNSATSVNTLTVGNGESGSYAYSGAIQNNVAVTKIGSGTFELRNTTNSYSGKTTVSAGTLRIAAESVLGAAPNAEQARSADAERWHLADDKHVRAG